MQIHIKQSTPIHFFPNLFQHNPTYPYFFISMKKIQMVSCLIILWKIHINFSDVHRFGFSVGIAAFVGHSQELEDQML